MAKGFNMINASEEQKMYDSLVTGIENNKLPENIFKNYFLPVISGVTTDQNYSKVMEEWISVAGTAMSSVDIINDNGEVLFTTPPILDTSVINKMKNSDNDKSFTSILENYAVRNVNFPPEAKAFLRNELNKKLDTIGTDTPNITTNWKKIFTKYGLVEDKHSEEETRLKSDDDLEYD